MKRKSFSVLQRTLTRTAILFVASCLLVVAFVLKVNAEGAELQVKNGNTYDINAIFFKRAEYVGQCPGTGITPGVVKARFVSRATPTAPKRRVTIKNTTEGISTDPYPFTDREYAKSEYSQGFDISFGDKHKGRTFSVLEGENNLEYEIRDREKVVELGSITAEVSVEDLGVFSRDVVCEDKVVCKDETYYDYDDDDDKSMNRKPRRRERTRRVCRTVNECNCPS